MKSCSHLEPPPRKCGSGAASNWLARCALVAFANPALAQSTDPAALPSASAKILASVDADFDPTFLMGANARTVNLSRFRHGNEIAPGQHDLDVYVNDQWIARSNLRFATVGDRTQLCVDRELVALFSVNLEMLSSDGRLALARAAGSSCITLGDVIAEGSATADLGRLRLDVSVPQAALARRPRGYVDPSTWNRGVPAALLRYRMNLFHSSGGGQQNTSLYLGTNAGFNLGGWVFRHDGALFVQKGLAKYQNIGTYATRDLAGPRARIMLGDSFTDGMIFESVGIRGIQLTSDDRMLPDSRRGYAPVIRGVARGNARVSVRQNGTLLYETSVAAGRFEIDDMYATGFGAGLEVTVTEADGEISSFTVPFSSAPQLVRQGRLRFSLAAGQLRDGAVDSDLLVARGSAQYGLSDRLTLYGGMTVANGYGSALLGATVNTPVGALSADITSAATHIPGARTRWGRSLRLAYAGFIASTQTGINLASYMYSSPDYWDLRNAAALRSGKVYLQSTSFGREKRRLQFSIDQKLGRLGQVYVSASSADYWDRQGNATTAQLGYSKQIRVKDMNLGFNLDLSRTRNEALATTENRLLVSLTIPLGSRAGLPIVTANYIGSGDGLSARQLRVHGTALDHHRLSYGAFLDQSDQATSGGGSITYRGKVATFSVSGSAGGGTRQGALGISGGLVVHPGGVTMAHDLGETIAIVEANGAKGAHILNGPGIEVDDAGYAVVPFISPYRMNDVGIDPQGLPFDMQFETTSQQVAPTAGAVVMLKYKARMGRAGVLAIRMPDGNPPPFGLSVLNASGEELGLVGQGGRAFVSGLEDSGSLMLDMDAQRCTLDYRFPPRNAESPGYATIEALCQPVAEAMSAQSPLPPPSTRETK